jgi:hypothetical protein
MDDSNNKEKRSLNRKHAENQLNSTVAIIPKTEEQLFKLSLYFNDLFPSLIHACDNASTNKRHIARKLLSDVLTTLHNDPSTTVEDDQDDGKRYLRVDFSLFSVRRLYKLVLDLLTWHYSLVHVLRSREELNIAMEEAKALSQITIKEIEKKLQMLSEMEHGMDMAHFRSRNVNTTYYTHCNDCEEHNDSDFDDNDFVYDISTANNIC